MAITVNPERPDHPDAATLVEELEGVLAPLYPAESRHGFSVDRLLEEGVAFFVARVDGVPAACGGVLLVPAPPAGAGGAGGGQPAAPGAADGAAYGEVKRMYVRPAYRGHGLARAILAALADHARGQGVMRLRLETGIHQVDAIRLYEAWGFRRIGAFGPYRDDPNSRYYEIELR